MNTYRLRKRHLGIAAMLAGLAMSGTALSNERMSATDKIGKMDTNGDGMLSAEEHAAGAKKMFEKMDANRDGNVTAAEMEAGHKAMKDHKSMQHDKSMQDQPMPAEAPMDNKPVDPADPPQTPMDDGN